MARTPTQIMLHTLISGKYTLSDYKYHCTNCEYKTNNFVNMCSHCGQAVILASLHRNMSLGLVIFGVVLTVGVGVFIIQTVPPMLRPNTSVGGRTFTGTITEAIVYFVWFLLLFIWSLFVTI